MKKNGDELQGRSKIAILSGEFMGNWTRFINSDDEDDNIEFEQEAVSGKMRIVVRAIRPIKFGQQIYGWYGDKYFKEPPKKKRRKKYW